MGPTEAGHDLSEEAYGCWATHVPDGRRVYTTVYGFHNSPTNPHVIPKDTDGVVLENTLHDWFSEDLSEQLLKQFRSADVQYQPLLADLERRAVPVYLLDPHFSKEAISHESRVTAVESVIAVVLLGICARLKSLLKPWCRENETRKTRDGPLMHRRIARRRVLQAMLGASGLYCAHPLLSQVATFATHKGGILQGAAAWNNQVAHTLHPEWQTLTVRVRNAILAYKEKWLARREHHRHIATVLGPDHAGCFEDDLRESPETLLQFLDQPEIRAILMQSLLNPSTLYTIAKHEFNGDAWERVAMYEIPELRSLLQMGGGSQ